MGQIYKIIDDLKYNPEDDALFIESSLDKDSIGMIVGAITVMCELKIDHAIVVEERHIVYLLKKYYNAVEISREDAEVSAQKYNVIDIPTVRELTFEYTNEELKNLYLPKPKEFYEEIKKFKPYYYELLGYKKA
ncbi:hypothetical protein [Priestia megaterium]|uniref:hypothetical protein n=1 Tax=Priestia megaterium TaxID=1404 RepID=UPI002FFEFD38